MGGALLCFSAMAVSGRQLAGAMPTFELLFIRSLIGFTVISVLLCRFGWRQVRPRKFRIHLLRNASHFGGQYAWFHAVAVLPLADVFAIEFTTPIWTGIIAAFFLGERLTRPRVLAIVLGFAGILLILRPGLAAISPAALAMLAGAFGFAVSVTTTKFLTREQTPLTVLFYMTLLQMPMGLLPALGQWVWPDWWTAPWLLAVGLAALGAHFCLTRALSLGDATLVAPLDFLRLPLIALVGFAFYGEALEWWVLLGAAVIFTGNYLNIRAARRA